jgi:hypothetical protein
MEAVMSQAMRCAATIVHLISFSFAHAIEMENG